MRLPAIFALGALLCPARVGAQEWNSDAALALTRGATARRTRTTTDTALRDYKAQAHGFVLFLGQFGDGAADPPRLIKADQLELEVYWKAPRASKQRIVGWRDRAELPTDIQYHADHLGIVQNNFGPVIRLGEGDEVRDVLHPLSPGGEARYDFALGDTLTLALPQREVRVVALHVRPKEFAAPNLVGTLYVDAETADLVRMTFNFTPASYLDRQIEDISIALDNALWQGRFWLPYRQEIEIRRRATWLDIPVRGIIRGRWAIDTYVFNLGLVDSWFTRSRGEIEAAPPAERDSFPWGAPLDAALRDVAGSLRQSDLERVRREVQALAGRRALTGLAAQRLGARRLSDLLRANRVEGAAVGAGIVWRLGAQRLEVRLQGSYGLADGRVKGSLDAVDASGVELGAYRRVRDVADFPVASALVNSFASQEFGTDYGDYYLATGGRVAWRRPLGTMGEWSVALGGERVRSLAVRAAPATGAFRPNPPLGETDVGVGQLALRRRGAGFAARRDLQAEITVEAGHVRGGAGYWRLEGRGEVLVPVGGMGARLVMQGGVADAALPPHRAFVLGGRGTLLGDGFRSWGGTRALLLHAEWRVPVRLLALSLGSYAQLDRPLTVAPFVAAGWTARPVPGAPWAATPDGRVTVGLGLEWLGVLRLEAGYGLQSGRVNLALDVARAFWGIL